MKATVKLYQYDGEKENGFPVKVILFRSTPKGTSRKTLAYSTLQDWDPITELPRRSHPDYIDLYSTILNIRSRAVKMEFRNLTSFDRAYNYLVDTPAPTKVTDFYAWGQRCVDTMYKENRVGNAQSYTNSLDALKRFAPHLEFSDLTRYFLNDFKNYLRSRGNSNKTIKHYGTGLKAIYNRAVSAGVLEDGKPFEGFGKGIPTQEVRRKQRYLDMDSIRKLETAQLPEGQRRSVDLLLLQFYLGGMDFTDIYHLKKRDISRKRVVFFRQKLAEGLAFEVDVLVTPKAEAIITRYWTHEGDYIFPWRKDRKGYETFIQNTRRALKIVQKKLNIKLLPKDEALTTKVMRHTFATLGKFSGVHEDMLRELMGHERREIDNNYKAKFLEKERDAVQLKITGELAAVAKRKVSGGRKVVRRTLLKCARD